MLPMPVTSIIIREEQKKAVRGGYDTGLATYGNEAKKLLQDLQSRNERMFMLTFLILNISDTKTKLDNFVFQAASIAQKYNCILTKLDFQQEEGLMSSLPLGLNQIEIQRGLTTSSTACFPKLKKFNLTVYYARAVPKRQGSAVLRYKRTLKQPHHGG